jgi:hypothetical protein
LLHTETLLKGDKTKYWKTEMPAEHPILILSQPTGTFYLITESKITILITFFKFFEQKHNN